jgi:hypothetical protein
MQTTSRTSILKEMKAMKETVNLLVKENELLKSQIRQPKSKNSLPAEAKK